MALELALVQAPVPAQVAWRRRGTLFRVATLHQWHQCMLVARSRTASRLTARMNCTRGRRRCSSAKIKDCKNKTHARPQVEPQVGAHTSLLPCVALCLFAPCSYVERFLKFGLSASSKRPPDMFRMTTAKKVMLTFSIIVRVLDRVTHDRTGSLDWSRSRRGSVALHHSSRGNTTEPASAWDVIEAIFPLHGRWRGLLFVRLPSGLLLTPRAYHFPSLAPR